MKQRVLVFPCGSEIGLEIHRSLNFSTHFELFGGSSVDDHGMFVYKNYIGGLPQVDNPDFLDQLNAVIAQYKIDFVIPAHDSVVLKLAQAKAEHRLSCDVVTAPLETCEIARSKQKTYKRFRDLIPTPAMYASVNDIQATDLPIFLKPDVGQGSKGTYLASSLEDIAFYTEKDPGLLLMEYLPGTEYTVDCFTDKNGQLLFCEGRKRQRIMNGISVSTAGVTDKRFKQLGEKINQTLPFRGAWFFQVKENKAGELVLMEIAPRIAGTMALVRSKGVNLVLLSLFDALGQDVSLFENHYNIVIDRALENIYQHDINYQHVYIDFDDLVIFDGKVNPAVMAFIYQCLNKGIKIHLITRHKEVLADSLKKYHLEGAFDQQILVSEGDEKHAYITEKDAIFIDDSFAERKKVHEACDIPTFDSHMLEALMEKW